MRDLQCQKCGQRFGCGVGSGDCWCLQVEVDRKALEELTGGSGDCLCPDCLPLIAPVGNLRSAPVTPPRGA